MNDTISRQAAIDALDELCDRICEYSKKQRHTMCGACNLGSAFDVINELPSAEPSEEQVKEYCRRRCLAIVAREDFPLLAAERKGKWIIQSDTYHEYWECDQCGMGVGLDDVRNYCPNCGARMEE